MEKIITASQILNNLFGDMNLIGTIFAQDMDPAILHRMVKYLQKVSGVTYDLMRLVRRYLMSKLRAKYLLE